MVPGWIPFPCGMPPRHCPVRGCQYYTFNREDINVKLLKKQELEIPAKQPKALQDFFGFAMVHLTGLRRNLWQMN